MHKHGGDVIIEQLRDLFTACWIKDVVSDELRDAVSVSLYKNKGEKSDCSNYRGITFLSIADRIFAKILLDRLILTIAGDNLPESQCGVRANRGTADMILALRQIQKNGPICSLCRIKKGF